MTANAARGSKPVRHSADVKRIVIPPFAPPLIVSDVQLDERCGGLKSCVWRAMRHGSFQKKKSPNNSINPLIV
ncbi:hypothetical protein LL447_004524, partial [Serratia marcescens]